MSDADKIKEIQQRMKHVRRELGNDIVSSARDITNWRSFIRAKPWLCVAAAVAVGYALAPKGPPVVHLRNGDLESLLREGRAQMETSSPPGSPGLVNRLGRAVFSNLSGLVMRGALAYLGQRLANSSIPSTAHHEENAPF